MFLLYLLENLETLLNTQIPKHVFLLTLCQKQLSVQGGACKSYSSAQKHSGWILQIFFNLNKKTD